MELHLKIIGYLLIGIALLHYFFPRYFKWKQELSSLSIINRQMMYIHTFFISLMLLLMGILCISSTADLLNTTLGKRVSLGIAIFWVTRLWIQFFGYSSELWKGKSFETGAHIIFTIFWTYFSTIFILVYLS